MSLFISYWWRLFWREYSLSFLFALLTSGFLLLQFLSSTLILEEDIATVAFAAFFIRSSLTVAFLFLVPFYMIRLHQSQEILLFLTQGYSRTHFLLLTWISFEMLSFVLCLYAALCLFLLGSRGFQIFAWGLSLFGELTILISFCLFLSCRMAHSVNVSLTVLLYYMLGRFHDLIIGSFSTSKALWKLVPAFDHYTQTNWLIGVQEVIHLSPVLSEAALFTLLFLILATITYQKRWL